MTSIRTKLWWFAFSLFVVSLILLFSFIFIGSNYGVIAAFIAYVASLVCFRVNTCLWFKKAGIEMEEARKKLEELLTENGYSLEEEDEQS